ncbi:hypothetical protein [Beihai mantis shrimp virus 1]|uniref:hypothetical protein n=1 Tax=Beihai mantis shrimp virus 1 TaxID=1922428 RepID=UPI00090C5CF3|nr:hypothetical protein [Beihai mantis shrimp virus 1]APG77576.1 hypothetical protein [Beihai mantis shrimp virus 1]
METPAQQIHRLVQQQVIAEHSYQFTRCAEGFMCWTKVLDEEFSSVAATKQQAKHAVCKAILSTLTAEQKDHKKKCDHVAKFLYDGGEMHLDLFPASDGKKIRLTTTLSKINPYTGTDMTYEYKDEVNVHAIRYKADLHAGRVLNCSCLDG